MRLDERDYTLVELCLRNAAEKFGEIAKESETNDNAGLKSLKDQFEWQAKRALELANAFEAGELALLIPRQFRD